MSEAVGKMREVTGTPKKEKTDVDYSESTTGKEKCGNCTYFNREDCDCDKVRGYIQARMWCKLWKHRES